MSLTTLRESIRATRDVIYMNTGFTGPSPEPVLQRMREAIRHIRSPFRERVTPRGEIDAIDFAKLHIDPALPDAFAAGSIVGR